jgi:hypothetical protein
MPSLPDRPRISICAPQPGATARAARRNRRKSVRKSRSGAAEFDIAAEIRSWRSPQSGDAFEHTRIYTARTSSALSDLAFTILLWFVRVCLNSSTRIAASARQLLLLCGVVALMGALSTGSPSGRNRTRLRVRDSAPLHYQLVETLKCDIASPDKTSRAGQEVARQRGVNVSALLVPITATRFRDRKEGNALPRFGSKRTIRETCDPHHKSSAIKRGMLARRRSAMAQIPSISEFTRAVDAPSEKALRFFRDFTLSPVPDPLTVFACLIYEDSEPVVVIAACYAGLMDRAKAVIGSEIRKLRGITSNMLTFGLEIS